MDGGKTRWTLHSIRKTIRRHAKTEDPQVRELIDVVIAPLIWGFETGLFEDSADAAKTCGKSISQFLDREE